MCARMELDQIAVSRLDPLGYSYGMDSASTSKRVGSMNARDHMTATKDNPIQTNGPSPFMCIRWLWKHSRPSRHSRSSLPTLSASIKWSWHVVSLVFPDRRAWVSRPGGITVGRTCVHAATGFWPRRFDIASPYVKASIGSLAEPRGPHLALGLELVLVVSSFATEQLSISPEHPR